MYYLSLAVLARGEQKYIVDWVAYHLGLGIDHIFIYDNETLTTYEKLLLPKFSTDKVTIIHFPGDTKQTVMTEHALYYHKNKTRYLGFIDVDEYIVPIGDKNLKVLFSEYEKYSALCIHWILFGSNQEKIYRAIPVVERFTRRASETDRHIKSFVDPQRTGKWVTVHKFTHSTKAVDENFNYVEETDSRPEPATSNKIFIAHYVTKSYEECLERRNRPRADIPAKHNMPEFFTAHDRNDVEDLRALELWKKICTT